MREALGDDRRALALQPRDLRAQRSPRGALVARPTLATDDLLLVLRHTRLLAGRERFYQRHKLAERFEATPGSA
ncbi:MAG TPA: hypothetical protein VK790_11620 [Solirubrobacteraceae bacterium]|nr:hypothetical protein [Solirubrobacteraceae bacterium]